MNKTLKKNKKKKRFSLVNKLKISKKLKNFLNLY